MMCDDVQWCIMMHNDVWWCIMCMSLSFTIYHGLRAKQLIQTWKSGTSSDFLRINPTNGPSHEDLSQIRTSLEEVRYLHSRFCFFCSTYIQRYITYDIIYIYKYTVSYIYIYMTQYIHVCHSRCAGLKSK